MSIVLVRGKRRMAVSLLEAEAEASPFQSFSLAYRTAALPGKECRPLRVLYVDSKTRKHSQRIGLFFFKVSFSCF